MSDIAGWNEIFEDKRAFWISNIVLSIALSLVPIIYLSACGKNEDCIDATYAPVWKVFVALLAIFALILQSYNIAYLDKIGGQLDPENEDGVETKYLGVGLTASITFIILVMLFSQSGLSYSQYFSMVKDGVWFKVMVSLFFVLSLTLMAYTFCQIGWITEISPDAEGNVKTVTNFYEQA